MYKGSGYRYLYNYFKPGDEIICLSDHGWSPGCITIGVIYKVVNSYEDYINIIGDNGALYKTDDRCFQNYAEYLSEKREDRINKILK